MRRVFGYYSSILLAPVGAEGSGGGGGASGDGGGSRSEPGGDEATKTGLTKEDADAMITKAINGRFKAFEEKQAKAQEASSAKLLETFTGVLEEKLQGFKPATDESKDGKGKPATTDFSQSPEFRALKKQNEDIARQLEVEREEKKTAKAKARDEAMHSQVQSTLSELGITDPKSVRLLLENDGTVGYEDDASDSVVFKEEGGALPLKKGLESWVKSSPLAKRFLSPTGASGSGARPDRNNGARGGTDSNGKASTSELGQALSRELGVPIL